MNTVLIIKIGGTLALVVVVLILQKLLQRAIDRYVRTYKLAQRRNLTMHKTKTIVLYILLLAGIFLLWGFAVENVLVSVLGILGLVAIGFVAVWSILSNVVAGVLLFFNQTLRIEDEVELLPEGIRGTVMDINSFFVVLEDKEGARIHVPNNFFFQKYVKHIAEPGKSEKLRQEMK